MPIEVVTPEDARLLIEASNKVSGKKNRALSKDNVTKLKNHIVNGEWYAEANPGIFILDSGFIMNGQHTAHAIAASGKAVAVNVVRDADEAMMPFIDTGRSRSAGDLMAINGVTNHSIKTAATKVLYAYREKNVGFLGKSPLSNNDVYEFYMKNTGMDAYCYKAQSLNTEPGVKSSVALAFLYEADPTGDHSEVIESWYKGLNKNVGLVENDPRTALMRKIRSKKERKLQRSARDEVIEYIKSWNAWVSDAEIKNLTVGAKEGIPRILPASNKIIADV